MRAISIAATGLLLLASEAGWAHPRPAIGAEVRIARVTKPKHGVAFAGEPTVRIRTASTDQGLAPLAFAKWLAANPRLAGAEAAKLRRISGKTDLLNHSATLFAQADRDGDRRISAIELADFIAAPVTDLTVDRTT